MNFQNVFDLLKASWGVFANRSVSYLRSHRLHRICVPAPVLQRRCPARSHFVRGRGAVSRSRRLDEKFQLQFSRKIKKAAPQGTKGLCRGQAAARWFGVAAERQFIAVKWLVWVRGYHERGEVSIACLGFWTISRTYHVRFVELHKSETSPDKPFGMCYTIKWIVMEKDGGLHNGREKHRRHWV